MEKCGGCGVARLKWERGWWDHLDPSGKEVFYHRKCVPVSVYERHRKHFFGGEK